ncbi:endonuclease-reverse transcriptase domain-containing protein [Phthorimaea operculella]|nr:endonuclease-reverse transcriptase domain-containing protein [Phthorimaea operculella]
MRIGQVEIILTILAIIFVPKQKNFVTVTETNNIEQNYVNILFQNVCGINTKRDQYEVYLDGLEYKQQYVCLCEHFLNDKSIVNLHFEAYDLISYYARKNKIRGGSLILAEKGRQAIKINCHKYSMIDCFEVCGVKDKNSNIYIFCCYQNNNKFDKFLERLELLLQDFFDKKCIICGDFNINMIAGGNDGNKSDFLCLLRSYNFRHLVESITFRRNGIELSIDNVLTNLPLESIGKIETHHNGHSDGHAALLTPILTEDECKNKWVEQVMFVESRSFSKKNKLIFRQKILDQRWFTLGLNSFINAFKKIFNETFKKIKKKINLKKKHTIKWITRGIKQSSKFKRVLSIINKDHTHPSVLNFRKTYNRLYRKVMRCARSLTAQSEIKEVGNSSRGIWQIVNKQTNKQSKKIKKPLILKINNEIIHDPNVITEIFSKQFDHGKETTHQHLSTSVSLLKDNTKRVNSNMHCRLTNAGEIEKLIKELTDERNEVAFKSKWRSQSASCLTHESFHSYCQWHGVVL